MNSSQMRNNTRTCLYVTCQDHIQITTQLFRPQHFLPSHLYLTLIKVMPVRLNQTFHKVRSTTDLKKIVYTTKYSTPRSVVIIYEINYPLK